MTHFLVYRSVVGTVVLMTVKNTSTATKAGLLFSYYLVLSFWGAATLCMSLLTRNVGGQTKKTTATAINFILWATGNAIGMYIVLLSFVNQMFFAHVYSNASTGPQVFQSNDAPRYIKGFTAHMVCYACLIAVQLALRWHLKRQNAIKAQILATQEDKQDSELTHSFDDLTDIQNPNFVYIY
jgi:hypothetical protein